MQGWEYLHVAVKYWSDGKMSMRINGGAETKHPARALIDLLNERGNQKWELVAVVEDSNFFWNAFLKRSR
jgi:hypothetical protein